MKKLEQSILSSQNIGAGYVLAHTYTGTASQEIFARCLISNIRVTGTANINYNAYIAIQSQGSGSFHTGAPITTASMPSGTSALVFSTIPLPIEAGDVFRIYVKSGHVADNSAYIKTSIYDSYHLNDIYEGTLTHQDYLRLSSAVLFGKSTGGGSTSVAFRDNADGKDRVSATVDSDGNRTSVSLDET